MIRSTAVALALFAGLAEGGCVRAAEPEAGAREALARYDAANRANDWGALYELVSARARAGRSQGEFVRSGAANPEFAQALNARSRLEVLAIEIEGERARARARVEMPDLQALPVPSQARLPSAAEVQAAPLHSFERSFDLIREEGAWRVDLPPLGVADPAALERLERVQAASAAAREEALAAGGSPP